MAVLIASATITQTASAASIENSISSNQTTVKKGKYFKFTAKSVYESWEIGPFPIPFDSNFRTEVPSKYFKKPQTISNCGNCGIWGAKTEPGEFYGGRVWRVQSKNHKFIKKATWYVTAKAKAKGVKGKPYIYQGQKPTKIASTGTTAKYKVTCK